jgi:hypothetical protein
MSTGHTPIAPSQAPASERPPAGAACGDSHTLTLQLRAVRGGMYGRLLVGAAQGAPADTVRLRITRPPQEPLSFTA